MTYTHMCYRITALVAVCLVVLTIGFSSYAAQLDFSGYRWNIREWTGAPGPNYWSTNCAWVDENGLLHLRIKQDGGTWYCGEVVTTQSFGYGEYRWYVASRIHQLDTNVVGGLFTYYDDTHEIDIEFTYAFTDNETNLHYTVQPWWEAGHQFLTNVVLTSDYTTHRFIWNPREIKWQSWYGHSPEPSATNPIIAQRTYNANDVPNDTNEHVHMNLWLFESQDPVQTATQNLEMIVKAFSFTPSGQDLLFDEFDDGTMSNIWETFGDGSGIVETNNMLRLHPSDNDWYSSGYRTTNTISWDASGLAYTFSACLRTVDVTAASSNRDDFYVFHGIIAGRPVPATYDPYWASNAATLKAGYELSNDTITIDFYTKMNDSETWGTNRFRGAITNFTSYGDTNGLDLRFIIAYSNYLVEAYHGSNAVAIDLVSGSSSGLHYLGSALHDCHYNIGGQNSETGRGYAYYNRTHVWSGSAEYESPGDTNPPPPPNIVEIGHDLTTWRHPIDTKYYNSRVQVLYLANQIGRSGLMTQLQYQVASLPASMTRYTIRMQHTDVTCLSQQWFNSGWTTVYQADTTITQTGWKAYTFTNDFPYNNASNLLVDFSIYNDAKIAPFGYCTYSTSESVTQCFAVSANTYGDPLLWAGLPGDRKWVFCGDRFINVRLVFEGGAPIGGPVNLDFEDGAHGPWTNIPGWHADGGVSYGYVEGSPYPVHSGTNVLKLWDGNGNDQKLYQTIVATGGLQYTFSGYLYSQTSDPFESDNAYGALVIKWYGSSGYLGSTESAHFTESTTEDTWHYFAAIGVSPDNVTSARLECAIITLGDINTSGSILFDDLSLSAQEPPSPFALLDEFNDNSRSNIWSLVGNYSDAQYEETNGFFRVKAGTEAWQTTGYVTADPLKNGATGTWHAFSAVLTTISVDSVQSGEDVRSMLSICSEGNNGWYVTNSCMLQGRFDADADALTVTFFTKTNSPQAEGTIRLTGTISSVSAYLTGTGGIRMSIVLDTTTYGLRFSDPLGRPVPLAVTYGSTTGAHDLGSSLDNAYWLIGAQAVDTNRGSVYWDRTELRTSSVPVVSLPYAQQTSTDGQGLVTLTGALYDANGDVSRLSVQASTNNGASWFVPWLTALSSTHTATLASAGSIFQILQATTEDTGPITNTLTLTWNTTHASNKVILAGKACTNVILRILPDDHDVAGAAVTCALFTVDNEAPSHLGASVSIESGDEYTFNTNMSVAWSGFTDAVSSLNGYYCNQSDGSGTTSGQWAAGSPHLLAGTEDTTNFAFVWARDSYGNLGNAQSDAIILLSSAGDWDADGLTNGGEEGYGCDPLDRDSDNDDMSDGWEVSKGLDPTNALDAADDDDFDAYLNSHEFYWNTDPGNATSHLHFVGQPMAGGQDWLVEWNASTARFYTIYIADGALSNSTSWNAAPDCTDIPGVDGSMVYTDEAVSVDHRLYKISVKVTTD